MRQQLADMQHKQKVDALMAVYEKNVGPVEVGTKLDEPVAVGYDEIGKTTSVVGATDATQDLKPQSLMDELANSGVKYNPADVIMATHKTDGKLLWLEQGNSQSGLIHIMERHTDDFASRNVDDIPRFLNNVLKSDPIYDKEKDKNRSADKRLYADFIFEEKRYRVVYGTNGYIVSFFPITYGED